VGETREQDTARYDEPVLRVDRLTTRFDVGHNFFGRVTHRVHAVEQVSFDVYPGETLALVGESGSGKSTIGKTLQQLVAPTSGAVRYNGQDIFSMDSAGRQRLRQEIQYIFQDPYASLDPRKTVAFSIAEPIRTHGLLNGDDAIARRVGELLEQVGLKPEHARRYPHEFSGGQRQRVCIARALASNPKLIIADESVSALDVSIQAQILNLLKDLQEELGLTMLFISHDLPVIRQMCDRVGVMRYGELLEVAETEDLFERPQHPYSQHLLGLMPRLQSMSREGLDVVEG
jgi:glutathione transport system ATP-binding protein